MKTRHTIAIFAFILASFLGYQIYKMLSAYRSFSGVYHIDKLYNKEEKCRYDYSFTHIFANDYMKIYIPSTAKHMKDCSYTYSYKFPYSGVLDIINCEETLLQDRYKVKYISTNHSEHSQAIILESSICVIHLSEIATFTQEKTHINMTMGYDRMLDRLEQNKPYLWNTCENDR